LKSFKILQINELIRKLHHSNRKDGKVYNLRNSDRMISSKESRWI